MYYVDPFGLSRESDNQISCTFANSHVTISVLPDFGALLEHIKNSDPKDLNFLEKILRELVFEQQPTYVDENGNVQSYGIGTVDIGPIKSLFKGMGKTELHHIATNKNKIFDLEPPRI